MLLETGFDIVFLREFFGRAYVAIPIRAAQLLSDGPDFFVAIYKRLGKKSPYPGEFRVYDSVRSKKIRLGNRGFDYRPLRYPRHLMPKRGDKPSIGSLVEKVIEQRTAYFLERVEGFDFWHYNDLSALLRPVKATNGKVIRVILVGTRFNDRSYLEPQLIKIKPITIKNSFQYI